VNSLVHVGSYARELGASLERLFENALDWEHLPHAHAGSFSDIRLIKADRSGWRATVGLPGGGILTIDLRLDRHQSRWTSRTETDGAVAAEIRTVAKALGSDRCRVAVDFFVAGISDDKRAATGDFYRRLYAGLYDEDEALMVARATAIARGPGALAERRTIMLADGSTAAVPLYCPHRGLPLDAAPDADGIITCPWHGYRFDVRTGRCVSGQMCGWRR